MTQPSAYAQAGVDLDAGNRATKMIAAAVQSTFGPDVLSDVGSFGGLFSARRLQEMSAPVLVASTDGVGTKTKVAAHLNRWDSIGHDIVNHCTNDILVQGAVPLFFLDYVASAKLEPNQIATIVSGVAEACKAVGCALLGGETAEMPGVYEPGAVDLVGTIIGTVDRDRLIDGSRIQVGDVIIGLPSTGLHTNGFSLARKVLAELDWHTSHQNLGQSIGEALLAPHRSYLDTIQAMWQAQIDIRGLAHITGGGLIDNPPRIFPEGLGAVLRNGSWPVLPIFDLIQRTGGISSQEMAHVFNMGLGMLVIVPEVQAAAALSSLSYEAFIVGEIVPGAKEVTIVK